MGESSVLSLWSGKFPTMVMGKSQNNKSGIRSPNWSVKARGGAFLGGGVLSNPPPEGSVREMRSHREILIPSFLKTASTQRFQSFNNMAFPYPCPSVSTVPMVLYSGNWLSEIHLEE